MPVANLEAQKTAMANFLWMQYFNNYLLEQGLISEDIRNQMSHKIQQRYGNYQQPPASPDLYSSQPGAAMLD